ncbi:MAG: hypothetical protein WA766_05720 [Candidatus Acidiferrales bacterium]
MYKTIRITREDIRLGWTQDANHCPIARAVCRTLDIPVRAHSVEVDGNTVEVNNDRFEIEMYLPKKAQSFVERFDKREPVRPFSFRLDVREYVPETEEE